MWWLVIFKQHVAIFGGFHVDKNKHGQEIISFCTVIPDKMGLEDDSKITFLISHRKH